MKTYVTAAAVVILAAALYFSHFYAARHAERELDRTLRNWVAESNPTAGIQFSGVEIRPFTGTLSIHDLNIFTDRHLQRGSLMRFRLGYLMFLRMYLGDASEALDRELSLRAHLENVSWMDRYRLREIKFDTLRLDYRGNPADLLRNALRGRPFASRQELRAGGRGFAWSEPYLALGTLRADSLHLEQDIPAGSSSLWPSGSLSLHLRELAWRAPEWFTNRYSFFLRGFDYTGQTIPMRSLRTRVSYGRETGTLNIEEMDLRTEHVRLTVTGELALEEPAGSTPLETLTLSLSDYSERFRNVLEGMNRLLQLNMPATEDSVALPLDGTLDAPALYRQQ